MLKKAKKTVKMSKELVLSDSLKESIFFKKNQSFWKNPRTPQLFMNSICRKVEILVFKSVRKKISYKSVFSRLLKRIWIQTLTSFFIHFPDFMYTHLCKRVGSTFLLFILTISIKNQLFLKNPRKPILFYHGMSQLFESTRKKGRHDSYDRYFSPNYFEYRLSFSNFSEQNDLIYIDELN